MKTLMASVCLLALSGMPFSRLSAQTTGNLEGTVTTASGAPVPNAKVELDNPATGQSRQVTTDVNGHYRFNDVPLGHYRVLILSTTATPGGANFQPLEVEIQAGSPTTTNLTWNGVSGAPGAANGTINTDSVITAETVPLQMNNAQIEHNWNTSIVQNSPETNLVNKNGRATGGYNATLSSEAVSTGPGIARGPSVGGQRPISNNYRVDGVDNNNKVEPGPLVYVSNEATASTALFENQATPVFGHSTGGKFNSVARTGTNEFHGAFYDYLQNTHLNAIDQSWSRLGLTNRPRFDQNRLGASLGFPIIPSKIFFFGNFEYIPLGYDAPIGGLMYAPTSAGFQTLAGLPGISSTNLGILQQAFGNRVGAATQNVTIGGTSIPMGLVNNVQHGFQNQYAGTGGLDFTIGQKDAAHARYVHNLIDASNAGQAFGMFTQPASTTALVATVSEDHAFTPSVTNTVRLAYNRWDQSLSNTNFAYPGLSAFPNISVGGLSNLVVGPAALAQSSIWNTYQGNDTIGFDMRGHSLRVGADVLRYISSVTGLAAFRGNYYYSGIAPFLFDQSPDVLAQQAFGANGFNDNRTLLTAFIQDNWAVRPGFTLNLGVRYSYDTLPAAITRQGTLSNAGVPGLLNFRTPSTQTTNVAPNIGVAWAPGNTRHFVVRAGFGMMYDALYNPFLYSGGVFSPALGNALVTGNVNTATAGFLAGGGLQNPAAGMSAGTGATGSGSMTGTTGTAAGSAGAFSFNNLSAAQQRALTSTYFGNQKLPYSMQWNTGVQVGLWRNMVVEAKYLGSKDIHQPAATFLNQFSVVNSQQNLPLFFQQPAQTQLDQLTTTLSQLQLASGAGNAFTQAGFTNPITTVAPDGWSWYNAGTFSINQRLGALSFTGNYTYSHLIDNFTGTPLDLTFGLQKASSLFDHRHRGAITGVLDLAPLFGRSGFVHNVLANMAISGNYIYQSPTYLPALSNTNLGLTGYGLGTPAAFNRSGTAGVSSGVTPLTNSFGQTVAYLATNPNARFVQGAPGMAVTPVRNAFHLSPVDNVDLAVTKRFSYRDRWAFEIRADAYNVLNHSQFTGVPIQSFDMNQIGVLSNATLLSSFMTAGGTGFANPSMWLPSNARMLQLALRISF